MTRLVDLATVLRSKNAGPFQITIDVMFPDDETYRRVTQSNALTEQAIGVLYDIEPQHVAIIRFEKVRAIKITIPRKSGTNGSGSAFDRDVYGAQQHGLIAAMDIR